MTDEARGRAEQIERLTLVLGWSGTLAITLFLFENIKLLGFGVGYVYLFAALACASLLLVVRRQPAHGLLIQTSAPFLFAFLTYFFIRLLFDFSEWRQIKAITIGTSGGIVFAIAIGMVASIFICTLYEKERRPLPRTMHVLLFLLAVLYLAVDSFSTHFQAVRDNIFLVSNGNGDYQRPGNFIVIVAIIASIQLALTSGRAQHRNVLLSFLRAATLVVYSALIGVLLVTSQLIGSNTGFVVTLFVGLGTLTWVWRPDLTRATLAALVARRQMSPVCAFKKSLPKLIANGVLLAGVASMLAVGLLSHFGLEPQDFRLFGFSAMRVGGNSITSRLSLLSQNFLTQFAQNPVFGNLQADTLTTGTGTYAHSLVSLFSHLGIVGAILFAAYVGALYRDIKTAGSSVTSFYRSVEMKLLRIILIVIALGFASIGTFFTWMPMWFSLGFLFPPLIIRSTRKTLSYELYNRNSEFTTRSTVLPT